MQENIIHREHLSPKEQNRSLGSISKMYIVQVLQILT